MMAAISVGDWSQLSVRAYAGYEVHVVHVQPVHKNMMNHADEDYREAGVKAVDTKQHDGKATDMVLAISDACTYA